MVDVSGGGIGPAPIGWSVLSQNETSQVTPDGRVETGVTVRFQTTQGTVASVFIPDLQYTADNVRAAIAARAEAIGAVGNLTSDTPVSGS